MKTIHRMRVIFAGLFVFVGMVVGIDLISYWWGDKEPAWPCGIFVRIIFVGIYIPLLILGAYVLFNLGVPRPWNPTPGDVARKLDEQGLLTRETLYATRALQVTDYDDEGPSYLLELIGGGVLFLSGYYLYRIATPRKDTGTFPCTEFTLQRNKQTGQIVDIVCAGTRLSPEIIPLALSDVNFTPAPVPEDGQIIRDRTYDELYATIMRAIETRRLSKTY
jgi:hypothetical protein